jgi:flagellar biosynthesis/type III secretory pathway M-ring protein FliF/YscJ
LVVLLLGLRPALKILVADGARELEPTAIEGIRAGGALASPPSAEMEAGYANNFGFADSSLKAEESPKDQLNRLVTVDVDRAAQVLKKWMNEPERNAA